MLTLVCADPRIQDSGRYWAYTVNELGMEDVTAQINLIHELKCKELKRGSKAGIVEGPLSNGFKCTPGAAVPQNGIKLPFQRDTSITCAPTSLGHALS